MRLRLAIFTIIIFTFGLAIQAFATHISSHLRTDSIADISATDEFCLTTDLTADYQLNYYTKFPQRSNSTFKIINRGIESFIGSDCPGNTTENPMMYVTLNNVLPSGLKVGDSVELYNIDPNADTTPPVQSNIQATNISQTGATISWTTDESATHTIKYDTTSGSYDSYANTKAAGSSTTSASGDL